MSIIMRTVLTLLLACLLAPSVPAADKPNSCFCLRTILATKLGYLGQTDIETPNLDRLARRGATFTHAYNMGSWSGARYAWRVAICC